MSAWTRDCLPDIREQPHESRSPWRAAGWPSNVSVMSPLTTDATRWCLGQVALSPTRATGMPSMSVAGEPVMTLPPPVVASPTTINVLATL